MGKREVGGVQEFEVRGLKSDSVNGKRMDYRK